MLANLEEKFLRAVSVVRIALDSQGVHGRDVYADCADRDRVALSECVENFAVFISAPPGADTEPFYETGKTITEAVRKILATIKGREQNDGAEAVDDEPDAAPF